MNNDLINQVRNITDLTDQKRVAEIKREIDIIRSLPAIAKENGYLLDLARNKNL